MKLNKYVDRLLEEWIQYGRIIIALDYDDTISKWKFNDLSHLNSLIYLLKQCEYTGCFLVIFSACDLSRYNEIIEHTEKLGLKINSINKNPINLPYGNNGKIYYNILLDDRAGLEESIDILETALYKYRGFLQSKLEDDGS